MILFKLLLSTRIDYTRKTTLFLYIEAFSWKYNLKRTMRVSLKSTGMNL